MKGIAAHQVDLCIAVVVTRLRQVHLAADNPDGAAHICHRPANVSRRGPQRQERNLLPHAIIWRIP